MAEHLCDTRLGLAVGGGHHSPATKPPGWKLKPPVRLHLWFPSGTNEEEEDEEDEEEKTSFMDSNKLRKRKTEDCDNDDHGMRKKLRLSKDQSTLLEERFRGSNTLTVMEKQELAQKLGLRPRQVEVWFQNRRARTKLKQTEFDCDALKRWCRDLTDENKRLKKELHELRFYGSKVEAMGDCSSTEKKPSVLQLCN